MSKNNKVNIIDLDQNENINNIIDENNIISIDNYLCNQSKNINLLTDTNAILDVINNINNLHASFMKKTNDIDNKFDVLKFMLKEHNETIKKQNNKNKPIANITELCKVLTNCDQISILQRINSDTNDYTKVYMQNYTKNTDPKKKTLLGTIKILVQFNVKKQ